jgi:hypothetical protein
MNSKKFIEEAQFLKLNSLILKAHGEQKNGSFLLDKEHSTFVVSFLLDRPSFEIQKNLTVKIANRNIEVIESDNIYNSGKIALYSHNVDSYPPIEAVFMLGSPEIHAWLISIGWGVFPEFNDNFPAMEVVSDYYDFWQAQSPVYDNEIIVTLGGWHFPWPDNDWAEKKAKQFVALINTGSEPWVEIWNENGKFIAQKRIT